MNKQLGLRSFGVQEERIPVLEQLKSEANKLQHIFKRYHDCVHRRSEELSGFHFSRCTRRMLVFDDIELPCSPCPDCRFYEPEKKRQRTLGGEQ